MLSFISHLARQIHFSKIRLPDGFLFYLPANNSKRSFSDKIFTPNSLAFSYLSPGASPTTTKSVFRLTAEEI